MAVLTVGAVGYMCIAHAAILDALKCKKKIQKDSDAADTDIQ